MSLLDPNPEETPTAQVLPNLSSLTGPTEVWGGPATDPDRAAPQLEQTAAKTSAPSGLNSGVSSVPSAPGHQSQVNTKLRFRGDPESEAF